MGIRRENKECAHTEEVCRSPRKWKTATELRNLKLEHFNVFLPSKTAGKEEGDV